MPQPSAANPTTVVNLDFGHYLAQRQKELAARTSEGGIANYAFALDYNLRQKIAAIRPIREIVRALVSIVIPIQKQLQQMGSIAVGPEQYPEIHAMGQDCARQLGIGIPQIFIYYSPLLNAYTFATDDVAPMVVLSSGLVEAMEPAELKFVIGHECGHIHNLHGVYNTAVEMMVNPLTQLMFEKIIEAGISLSLITTIGQIKTIAGAIQGSLRLFFARWHRCAEITCDRAGLICCGDVETAQFALAKLVTGGAERLKGFNIEEYVRQISQIEATPLRFLELGHTHPLIPKRIRAVELFGQCDVLQGWRPERSIPPPARSKEETDKLCEQVIGIIKSEQPAENGA